MKNKKFKRVLGTISAKTAPYPNLPSMLNAPRTSTPITTTSEPVHIERPVQAVLPAQDPGLQAPQTQRDLAATSDKVPHPRPNPVPNLPGARVLNPQPQNPVKYTLNDQGNMIQKEG